LICFLSGKDCVAVSSENLPWLPAGVSHKHSPKPDVCITLGAFFQLDRRLSLERRAAIDGDGKIPQDLRQICSTRFFVGRPVSSLVSGLTVVDFKVKDSDRARGELLDHMDHVGNLLLEEQARLPAAEARNRLVVVRGALIHREGIVLVKCLNRMMIDAVTVPFDVGGSGTLFGEWMAPSGALVELYREALAKLDVHSREPGQCFLGRGASGYVFAVNRGSAERAIKIVEGDQAFHNLSQQQASAKLAGDLAVQSLSVTALKAEPSNCSGAVSLLATTGQAFQWGRKTTDPFRIKLFCKGAQLQDFLTVLQKLHLHKKICHGDARFANFVKCADGV